MKNYMQKYCPVPKKAVVMALLIGVVFVFPALAKLYAEVGYGGESQIQSFFDWTAGFLVKTIGTGVFLFGMIVAGIKITTGDQSGMRSAVMVMVGGAIIFLSKPLVGLLAKFSSLR